MKKIAQALFVFSIFSPCLTLHGMNKVNLESPEPSPRLELQVKQNNGTLQQFAKLPSLKLPPMKQQPPTPLQVLLATHKVAKEQLAYSKTIAQNQVYLSQQQAVIIQLLKQQNNLLSHIAYGSQPVQSFVDPYGATRFYQPQAPAHSQHSQGAPQQNHYQTGANFQGSHQPPRHNPHSKNGK